MRDTPGPDPTRRVSPVVGLIGRLVEDEAAWLHWSNLVRLLVPPVAVPLLSFAAVPRPSQVHAALATLRADPVYPHLMFLAVGLVDARCRGGHFGGTLGGRCSRAVEGRGD